MLDVFSIYDSVNVLSAQSQLFTARPSHIDSSKCTKLPHCKRGRADTHIPKVSSFIIAATGRLLAAVCTIWEIFGTFLRLISLESGSLRRMWNLLISTLPLTCEQFLPSAIVCTLDGRPSEFKQLHPARNAFTVAATSFT